MTRSTRPATTPASTEAGPVTPTLVAERDAPWSQESPAAPLDGCRSDSAKELLLAWYQEHGRDLPWRKTTDPYAILVSELMLQQYRV